MSRRRGVVMAGDRRLTEELERMEYRRMGFQLRVFCDGRPLRDTLEPSHKGRRAHIARLEFVEAGEKRYAVPSGPLANEVHDVDMWVPHTVSRRRQRKLRREGIEADEAMVCETIGADGTVLDVEHILVEADLAMLDDSHIKVTMRCPLCHLDLQARIDKITPYLDTLRHAGWEEVGLSSLGAILRE